MDWPPKIEVGDRVHAGVSSPDTGVVLRITKNRRWATVQWDSNGTRRYQMAYLFSVTRSLTEWVLFKLGKFSCPSCGYETEAAGAVCHMCSMPSDTDPLTPPPPGARGA